MKRYDQAYFDRWYRRDGDARLRRVLTAHKAAVAVATAEYFLCRPVKSVLDVGCGEGPWRAPLRKLRPGVHYLGVDSSEYAVARYGRSRNLRLLGFGQLAEVRPGPSVDLLVCSDVMHYLPTRELKRGLSGFAELCHGLAFLDVFCRGDGAEGDHEGFIARTPQQYRTLFEAAGFVPVGPNCYLSPALQSERSGLERF